ncbi:MAG: alanyl-tRNA editing protein [Lachnospiraceae bacterium]|nr:alanyl-tRNA editing protein [Lachnospiraceae bacterium]
MKNEREINTQTVLLYETDGMLTEFEATVTGCEKQSDEGGYFVTLDRTAFFPEGGGQQPDTGILVTKDKKQTAVTSVLTHNGQVRHYTDGPVDVGAKVTGRIDAKQRFSRMQDHGAEHLICGIIHELFGYENVGFHMSDDETVFDVDGILTDEQIRDVERRANEAVFENVPITVSFPDADEAEKTEYRSKLDSSENIRLVTIEGYDVCACCAPCLSSTGQLGVIKILSSFVHRGGMRMTLAAGMNAYRDYCALHDQNARIMEILSSKRDRTDEYVSDMSDRMLALKQERSELKKKITDYVAKSQIDRIKAMTPNNGHPFVMFLDDVDRTGLRETVNACTDRYDGIVCGFIPGPEGYMYIFAVKKEISDRFDLKAFSDDFNGRCEGKGGGSPIMVQGTTAADRKTIEEYINHVE